MTDDTLPEGTQVAQAIKDAERHAKAPALMKKVANENDHERLAAACVDVDIAARDAAVEHDLNRHAIIAVLYMAINRFAEEDQQQPQEDDDE